MDDTVKDHKFRLPEFEVGDTISSEELNGRGGFFSLLKSKQPETSGWGAEYMRLPELWTQSKGKGIKVAVLDTGCDLNHPDLKSQILNSKSFIRGQSVEDLNGHGTHCAGIIAAKEDGEGFVGAAPECKLLIAKVLGNSGGGSISAIVRGINWAVQQKADIISMSLGSPHNSPELNSAVHQALAKGITVVCAAGNDGRMSSVNYPGRLGSVITVGSHDRRGAVSEFSSMGSEIDFIAPGSSIWSTYKKGGYATLSGTSMATPAIAGICALIMAKHKKRPGRTPIRDSEDVRQHLIRISSHPGHFDPRTGHGMIIGVRDEDI